MLDRIHAAVWKLDSDAFFARATLDRGTSTLLALPRDAMISHNAKAREIMARLASEASRADTTILLPVDDRILTEASQAYLSGENSLEARMQVEIMGETAWFHVAISLPATGDETTGVVLCALEVSHFRREEAALQAARRSLEHAARGMSMAHLARSVTDAVSQPITSILFSGRAALTRLEDSAHDHAQLKADIERMMVAASRSADMIRQAREFADMRESELETLSVRDVVEPLVLQLERELSRRSTEIRFEIAEGIPNLTADRVQIQQVVLNLILNALEAHEVAAQRSHITLFARTNANAEILICVGDQGHGIAPNIVDKIFEPMFTTKPGQAGVGLAVSRNIVEAHGGEIWLSSTGPQGTRFSFTLPADGVIKDTHSADVRSLAAAKRQLQ